MRESLELLNIDNMTHMRAVPDKFYDLAIVDPPYGSSNIVGGYTSGKGGGVSKQNIYHKELWNQSTPDKEYFNELFRVSKRVIIWGQIILFLKYKTLIVLVGLYGINETERIVFLIVNLLILILKQR